MLALTRNLHYLNLIDFETEVCQRFANKEIRAPVHLQDGCEEQLIAIFRDFVDKDDWITTTWRSHLHCLLKGVPKDHLMKAILDGRSISLCFPEFRIVSSAIVAGMLPVAVGLAMAIKRRGERNKVVAFLGDMASETGAFYECRKYAQRFSLPVLWVVEDNGLSVCTPTDEVWGKGRSTGAESTVAKIGSDLLYYRYRSKYPHAGGGVRIQF